MEETFWLNVNIEGHIADLYVLFRYFKNIWPFLIAIILLKIFFFPLVSGRKTSLSFQEKDVYSTDGIVLLASWIFYDIIMS